MYPFQFSSKTYLYFFSLDQKVILISSIFYCDDQTNLKSNWFQISIYQDILQKFHFSIKSILCLATCLDLDFLLICIYHCFLQLQSLLRQILFPKKFKLHTYFSLHIMKVPFLIHNTHNTKYFFFLGIISFESNGILCQVLEKLFFQISLIINNQLKLIIAQESLVKYLLMLIKKWVTV